MIQSEGGALFRVCSVDDHRWDVLRGSSTEPLASFDDKHAALAYAMSLARERTSWQLPFGPRQQILSAIFTRR
jgi:hypothetical protein